MAQTAYPERPVRLIVPFAAGSATDQIGRAFMAKVSETLGQTVVVENKPGVNGMLGAAEVAKAVSGKVDTDTAPLMGAEDFSFMLLERPGAYIFLGNGDTAMVHHPAYNFDDSAIPFGSSWYAGMVEARMPAA